MKEYMLIATITLFGLVGCTHRPIPVASSHPATAQLKMQAAHHWNVLADDIAERLKKTLELTFPNAVVKPSLFIKTAAEQEKIPFGKAFHNLLTTKLVQEGLVILKKEDFSGKTLVVDYDMQVIHHKDRRLTYPVPGTFTLLAGGAWMVAQAQEKWKYPGLAWFPFTLLADIAAGVNYYLPGETNTEVLLTTSVTMGQQYIFGDSRIYYINDGDYDHYENFAKTYRVVDQ